MTGSWATTSRYCTWGLPIALAVTIIGVLLWWHWDELICRYWVWRLSQVSEAERTDIVAQLEKHGLLAAQRLLFAPPAQPGEEEDVYATTLSTLLCRWGPEHPATKTVASDLVGQFPHLPVAVQQRGCKCLLALVLDGREQTLPEPLAEHLLKLGEHFSTAQAAVRPQMLSLLLAVVQHAPTLPDRHTSLLSGLVAEAAREACPRCRAETVRLAMAAGSEALKQIVPLLHDPDAEVRCLTLLALGSREDIVSTDDLINWLHDPDPKARDICTQALRSRGLIDERLRLAWRLTHPDPTVRAQVPAEVFRFPDLDINVWLERLCRDPSAAVRAAAVRAAGEAGSPLFTQKLADISANDPSPTVRQLAEFYLRGPSSNRRLPERRP